MSISAEEFSRVHEELVGLKQANYDLNDKVTRMTPELARLSSLSQSQSRELTKLKLILKNNKEKVCHFFIVFTCSPFTPHSSLFLF